jgi:hypothetical protein
MSNAVNLNANNPNDVGFAQKVSVLTGEPNVWLLIYSGIAYQRQRAEGSSGFLGIGEHTSTTDADVTVTLDNLSGVLLQSAVIAGMANIIEEDTWGQWIIQSNSLSLRDNGDLVLSVTTSVTGEDDAEFYAFNYHVSAKVILDAASINGAIRWKKTLAAPLDAQHFTIVAYTEMPGPPGTLLPVDHVEATGVPGTVDSSDSVYYSVPYTITGALLGKTVRVGVKQIDSSFNFIDLPQNSLVGVGQISGPNPVILNVANRHATEVNFEMSATQGPR